MPKLRRKCIDCGKVTFVESDGCLPLCKKCYEESLIVIQESITDKVWKGINYD